jgi:hypothetical protein
MQTTVIRVYPADAARLEEIRRTLVQADGQNRHGADALSWLIAEWDVAALIAYGTHDADSMPAPIGMARLEALRRLMTPNDFNQLSADARRALYASLAAAGFAPAAIPEPELSARQPSGSNPPPGTWRPIATAPKDGTPILIHDPVMGLKPCEWRPYPEIYRPPNRAARYAWCVQNSEDREQGGCDTCDHPTHWMPLPEAPA